MKRILIGILGIAILGLMSLPGVTTASDNGDKGKDLYADNCRICHGIKGDGKGQAALALNPKPTDFTKSGFWKTDTEKKITESIMKGRGIMPPVALKPDEIKAVIEYMTRTFKKQ
jgi:mono/diheme cytochrome c family protein